MSIDYLTLMLVNIVAGLVIMAAYIYLDLTTDNQKRWVTGLGMSGLVGVITGLHMIFNWPLPGAFNIVFGEMAVFFGVLLLGLAFSIWHQLDLMPVALYSAFAGIASLVIGAQVLNLGLTKHPELSGIGFIWMGLIGLFAVPMLLLKNKELFRKLGAVGLIIAAIIWGLTGYQAYWGHLKPFGKWKPMEMQYQLQMQKPAN